MDEQENTGPTVEVRFIAKTDPKYKVTETPFRVPVKLGRFGLSGVINHLLGLGTLHSKESARFVFFLTEQMNTNLLIS